MSDETTREELDAEESGPEADLKRQREHIKKLEEQLKEKEGLERKVAFIEAGVDLDSKAGQLLFKAYDGNLEAEDIRNEASELNALRSGTPTPKPNEPEHDEGERRFTEERSMAASGHAPADTSGAHPGDVALTEGRQILEQQGSRDDALGHAFAVLAEAGYKNKDKRVIYDPRQ